MIVRYLGKKSAVRKGCPVCGGRGRTEYKTLTTNTYYTPSGNRIFVRIGKEYEVSDADGEFLLSLGDDFSVGETAS
ncbi:MAG: hypothetical protein J6S67_15475 [Methanobrevibacter sp.]|nr:hypothetical protein [Methanobrevibacter sp.]